jgi:LPS export ABC transporter protein LptC
MNWRWIVTVVLLAALLAGYSAFLRRDVANPLNNNTLEQPGYYLSDAIVTQSKEDGSPGITLVAKRIEQQQREEDITLIDVNVDYLQTPEQRWILTAKRAVVPRNSKIVQFTGDVELRPKQSTTKTYLHTQALTVDTEKNRAYSNDSPVEVRMGAYLLTAQRIDVDLRSEQVRLRAVNGRSTPEQPDTERRRE